MFTWSLNALFLMFSAWLVPGVHLNGFWAAIFAVLIIGVIHLFVRPLIVLLTLPLTLLTFGLFLFIINALTFWMASGVFSGFYVDNFMAAFWCSLLYSFLSSFTVSK